MAIIWEKTIINPEALKGENLLQASLHHKAFSWLCQSEASEHFS